ncbi:MAG: hypothetical protein EBT03_11275, partial [Betaproteobacteria bacterium]|nr:hypothetical protein [Betaproteobacteria bacterium]
MLKNLAAQTLTWQTDCFAADPVTNLPVFNADALPVVQRAQRTDDLQQALPVAEALMRNVDSLVVCGIGGSALGAAA